LNALLLIVILVVLVVVAMAFLRNRGILGADRSGPWPYYTRRPLSQPEQMLYHRLVKALPDHIVLAQVQVSRILGVKKGANFHEWNNRINRLTYDFVICGKDSKVLAAIELDDSSHSAATRVEADTKKERASAAAGVPLLRWNVKSMPDPDAIRATIAAAQPTPPQKLDMQPAAGRVWPTAARVEFQASK
jgi:hypothetical protein